MNITCTAPGTLPSSTGPAVSHNYIERSLMEAHSPITIWQSGQGQHSSQIPSVSVKQEPMDVEHNSRSPNNDSGISPGHGSSGSSAGRPSPGQTTSFGSPEHYDVNSVTTTPYSQQQHAPVWGINVLAQPHGQIVTSPSGTEHPQTPRRTPTSSPRLNSQPPQAATTLPGNRSPIVDRSMASPIQNVESAMHTPTRGIAKSPPVPESNSPPGLNASLSDENSRSSSGSNTSLPDGENEYYQSTQQISDQSPLRCLEMTVEHSSMLAGLHTLGPGVNSNGARNVYQCPLCDYNTLSRIDFNNHNISHCPEQKCRKCDFVTKDMAELRNHLREVHMISPLAEEMETTDGQTGIAVPRINSQGKVKTFRCKQCSFVSVTKVDFWAHSRTHIRKEKLLNCPRCPFVTEYKHHLEYHLRNHANSKPFQCYKCQYSCVNKSMLNSHLKSHSTVYQYRCASCNYATKYCHSLKLHLRKYRHQPAMVLNPDGSPNPNPIIDVYGTRRGPKPRLQNTVKQPTDEKKSEISLSTHAPLPLPIFPGPYAMIPQQHGEHQFPYPYSHLIPSPFPSKNNNNPLMPAFPQNGNVNLQEKTEDTQDDLRNFPHVKYENFMVSSQYYHTNNNNNNNNIINGSGDTKTDKSTQNQGSSESYFNNQVMEEHRVSPKTPGVSPLDLSKPDVFDNNVQVCDEQILSDMPQTTPVMAKSSTKHRRKGQAYKLDHISRKLQQQCLTDQNEFNNSNVPESEGKPTSPNKMVPHAETQLTVEESVLQQTPELEKKINQDFPKSDAENKSGNEKNSTTESNRKLYHCTYCEITYSDAVLYTMHKGYHGFQDPFKCNMCGEQTADKVEFFVHIARSSHC